MMIEGVWSYYNTTRAIVYTPSMITTPQVACWAEGEGWSVEAVTFDPQRSMFALLLVRRTQIHG